MERNFEEYKKMMDEKFAELEQRVRELEGDYTKDTIMKIGMGIIVLILVYVFR